MMEPSSPALRAIWRAGALIALRTISTPTLWSLILDPQLLQHLGGAQKRTSEPNRQGGTSRSPSGRKAGKGG